MLLSLSRVEILHGTMIKIIMASFSPLFLRGDIGVEIHWSTKCNFVGFSRTFEILFLRNSFSGVWFRNTKRIVAA